MRFATGEAASSARSADSRSTFARRALGVAWATRPTFGLSRSEARAPVVRPRVRPLLDPVRNEHRRQHPWRSAGRERQPAPSCKPRDCCPGSSGCLGSHHRCHVKQPVESLGAKLASRPRGRHRRARPDRGPVRRGEERRGVVVLFGACARERLRADGMTTETLTPAARAAGDRDGRGEGKPSCR